MRSKENMNTKCINQKQSLGLYFKGKLLATHKTENPKKIPQLATPSTQVIILRALIDNAFDQI